MDISSPANQQQQQLQQSYPSNQHIPQFQPFQSRLQPMYGQPSYGEQASYAQMPMNPVAGDMRSMSESDQKRMEDAFERALKDAQEQSQGQSVTVESNGEEIEEIIREPKGDLEA